MSWGLSILTVLTLGAAFVIFAVVLDRYQERQLDESLIDVARVEAEEAPTNHFSFSSRPGPAANDVGPLEKYGVIFDESGHAISATHPFDRIAPVLPAASETAGVPFDFPFGPRHYRGVVVPIPGYPARRLLIAASRDDLDGDSRFVRKAMAIALLAAVAWLLGAIRWLVRWNMREHARIAETLHRIATGDVDARASADLADQDLRRVAGDIDEIAQKLARLIAHQRRFIAHAAHELRSPLTALHGEIQQALRKERTADEYRASLAFLLRASARLKHLADELLELARAEHEPKTTEPVSVDAVLADVEESLAPLAHEKEVTIARDRTESVVVAKQSDVERILRNLLDNAIRHSPNGGRVQLEVEARELVHVRVRDNGDGVRPEEREAIFEPFHRSPENRARGRGTGLGLAIARELARRHGGDLVVGSELNCFDLSLPAPVRH
jgi:two-component system heavy metal sensor histidine kinase CusS